MGQPLDIEKAPVESVRPVEQDVSPPTSQLEHKKRAHWEKLGLYNLLVLTIGTIIIVGCFGFLIYFWSSSIKFRDTERISRLWFSIVRRSWSARVVTLTTVLVRVAIGAQLTVFAALMAAVILERIGASPEDLPLLSMIRCSNTGPQSLIWNILHNIPKRSQLGYSLLIVITILNSIVLQFMSTILLADFDAGVVAFPETVPIYWGVSEANTPLDADNKGSDYWKSAVASLPPFAEYSSSNATNGSSFMDTGHTYRGFIPFTNSTQREQLRQYNGPMTVLDERVLCVKPTLSNAIYHVPALSDDFLTAKVVFNDTHADAVQIDQNLLVNCTMPHFWDEADPRYWYASICQLNYGTSHLKGGLKTAQNTTHTWLFFNVTTPKGFNWTEGVAEPDVETVEIPLHQTDSPAGPWSKISHPNMTVDVSICMMNPQQDAYDVEASIAKDSYISDSGIGMDTEAGRYITWLARMQLDAMGRTELLEHLGLGSIWEVFGPDFFSLPSSRAIFDLNPVEQWKDKALAEKYNVATWDAIHGSMNKVKPWDYSGPTNDSFIFTPKAGSQDAVHRYHSWITQDILNNTNNPARAMQAVGHIIMQTAYYDWEGNYDLRENATCATNQPRSFPTYWQHFTIVGGLLSVHFSLVLIALFLFLQKTEMSLLGNAWQAISQVVSTDTAAAVHHASTATDREVIKSVRQSGAAKPHVIIRRSNHISPVEVRS